MPLIVCPICSFLIFNAYNTMCLCIYDVNIAGGKRLCPSALQWYHELANKIMIYAGSIMSGLLKLLTQKKILRVSGALHNHRKQSKILIAITKHNTVRFSHTRNAGAEDFFLLLFSSEWNHIRRMIAFTFGSHVSQCSSFLVSYTPAYNFTNEPRVGRKRAHRD